MGTPLFAGITALITVLALGVVLAPLWRGSRGLVVGMVVILLGATFALYRVVGTPAALLHGTDAQAAATPTNMDDAIAQLRNALKRDPDHADGWVLLGRALAARDQLADARDAFARAAHLSPDNADILVAAAQAQMAAADDHRLDARSTAWLRHALQIEPGHQRARWYLGAAERQAGDAAAAAATWQPLLDQVDGSTRADLLEQIQAARKDAGLTPLDAAHSAGTAGTSNGLIVHVALAPALAAAVQNDPQARIFVIAREPGKPMPVAAEKRTLDALPLTAILDDNDSPMPTNKLSQLKQVEVVARLSRSGSVARSEGDAESAPVEVALPANAPIDLIIGAQHPGNTSGE